MPRGRSHVPGLVLPFRAKQHRPLPGHAHACSARLPYPSSDLPVFLGYDCAQGYRCMNGTGDTNPYSCSKTPIRTRAGAFRGHRLREFTRHSSALGGRGRRRGIAGRAGLSLLTLPREGLQSERGDRAGESPTGKGWAVAGAGAGAGAGMRRRLLRWPECGMAGWPIPHAQTTGGFLTCERSAGIGPLEPLGTSRDQNGSLRDRSVPAHRHVAN